MHMIMRLLKILTGKETTSLRERIFCSINIVAGILAILALLESLPLVEPWLIILAMSFLVISILGSVTIVLRFHMINIASIIVGVALCLIVLPLMYFTNGGIQGGSTIWLSINLVYTFLMFEGKQRIVFIGLDILTDIACYGISYLYPDWVQQLPSREAVYIDSLFAVVMVGFAVSFMIVVYIRAYSEQQEILEQQKMELEKASESKNHFFASMSHEIRTPINTIIGLNEMILRENSEGATREYAKDVENASKMLLSLVNDILDLSQMEMKKMEIIENVYDISQVLREVVDMIKVPLKEKKLELQMDIDEKMPKQLFGDRKRIMQILINLMTNAVKYTPSGTITLMAGVEYLEEKRILLKLSVQDTGIGIHKEDLVDLFDSFKRVDHNKNENVQGSGLGLTITKQLVDLMHGEIKVDSIYSKGSTFTVMLPQRIMSSQEVGSLDDIFINDKSDSIRYQQSFEAPEARILVVDDNAMNLKVVSTLLSSTKVQIDTALSGEECLARTKEHYYHVILLDHMMPVMDGIETLSLLQKQENGLCRDSAVIALTANAGGDAESYYQELGFDGYLEKPISSKLLEQYILTNLPSEIVEYRKESQRDDSDTIIKKLNPKKKKKVVITTDCVAELPQDMIEKYGIQVMYLYILTEYGRFADTKEIDSDNLAQYVTDDTTTAFADSVSVEEYEQFFAEQLDQAEQVIHISMAANSGKSYHVAVEAAKGFDHVRVIDSKHISCGQSLVALHAAKLAHSGMAFDEICENVEEICNHIETCFVMPSTKIFAQNGYVNPLISRVFEIFHLHPVVKMRKSRIQMIGGFFGNMQMARIKLIRRKLRFKRKINSEVIFISHVGLNVKQQHLIRSEIDRKKQFEHFFMQKASFSSACNSGMGTFGFAYYVD